MSRAAIVLLVIACGIAAAASPEEGVALALVYDTSGSMKDPVRDSGGKLAPKYIIANRALGAVVDRLEKVDAPATGSARKIHASLVVFAAKGGRDAVPFGEFKPAAFRSWLAAFSKPDSGTPLGEALRFAAQPVLASPLRHKHILLITDGMNTVGPDPAAVIPGVRRAAAERGASLGIHFIAFDVAAKVFDGVRKLDCTVVSASNETQLHAQLGFILEEKILLEDEEPRVKKKEPQTPNQ